MYKSESEHQRSQSAEGRGGGATIAMPSNCVVMYGSRAKLDSSSETEGEGGGGGTIELGDESVTGKFMSSDKAGWLQDILATKAFVST